MRFDKFLVLAGIACFFCTCQMANYTQNIEVETLNPAVFNIPEHVKSIDIFNLVPHRFTDFTFQYESNGRMRSDSALNYIQISKSCTDAVAQSLEKAKYFAKVRNLNDSIQYLRNEPSDSTLFRKLGVDALLFLDSIDFKLIELNDVGTIFLNRASLKWSLNFKDDTLSYWYSQTDTLIFNGYDLANIKGHRNKLKSIVESSSEYLGKAFATKMVPSWIPVERMYYRSNNAEMIKAQNFADKGEWLKAAEIWNKLTKNENTSMASKAAYNMALCCEMEGNLDAAIDWVVRSFSTLKEENEEHKNNCQRYINLLATRKKEIEKLSRQVRNN